MCTLSIIPTTETAPNARTVSRATFRLVFNRDEQRTRALGTPIAAVVAGSRRAIHPSDPDGGGTWIAVNDAGIAVAILNRNEHEIPDGRGEGVSRGLIIPHLLSSGSLQEVAQNTEKVARTVARGFRLIATDGRHVLEVIGGNHRCETALEPFMRPFVRASSGLGDELVRTPRTELFEGIVVRAPCDARADAQAAFHNHAWPDRRHLSVRMDRAEARSVSQTLINVTQHEIVMQYAPRAGESAHDGFAPVQTLVLARGAA